MLNFTYKYIYCKSGFFRPAFMFAIFASGFKRRKFELGEQMKNSKLGLNWQKSGKNLNRRICQGLQKSENKDRRI